MGRVLEALGDWFKAVLIDGIEGMLGSMFGGLNNSVNLVASIAGTTPQGWAPPVFGIIRTLSESVILPIAGIIITYILAIELITMVMDRNSFHDNVDTFMFFKYIFKAGVAVLILSHTYDIVMGIFDVAHHVISRAGGVINNVTDLNIDEVMAAMNLEEYSIGELMLITLQLQWSLIAMIIMSVLIPVVLYGRMMEIYLTISVAPIPLATITHKEWGQMGNNYLRALMALGFQGFLIMICVGIYAVLIQNIAVSDNFMGAIAVYQVYTVLLCFALFKTGTIAKSIFNAH